MTTARDHTASASFPLVFNVCQSCLNNRNMMMSAHPLCGNPNPGIHFVLTEQMFKYDEKSDVKLFKHNLSKT